MPTPRLFALTASALAGLALTAGAADPGWVSLFDGKTLEGWTQKNGTATYRVQDGAIYGRTAKGSPNSFLCSNKEFGDFELEFEVKLFDAALNSGVRAEGSAAARSSSWRSAISEASIRTATCTVGDSTSVDSASGTGAPARMRAKVPGDQSR